MFWTLNNCHWQNPSIFLFIKTVTLKAVWVFLISLPGFLVSVFTDNSNAQFCYSVVFSMYNAYQKVWAKQLAFYLFLFCFLRCKRMFCAFNTIENNGAVKNSLLLNSCLNTLPKEYLLLLSHITYKKFCSRYFNILYNSGTKWHCPWVIVGLRYALGNNHTCCSLNTEIATV